jgi:hypothetical protein
MVVVETISAVMALAKIVDAVTQGVDAGATAKSLFKGVDSIIRAQEQANQDQDNEDLSVEAVAEAVLIRKKTEEKLSRLATKIDIRWGPNTWASILEARQAKLDARDQAIERRATQRRERADLAVKTLKEIGAVLIILMCLGGAAWILYRLKCTAGAC